LHGVVFDILSLERRSAAESTRAASRHGIVSARSHGEATLLQPLQRGALQ
jgi:hypothetical protein